MKLKINDGLKREIINIASGTYAPLVAF